MLSVKERTVSTLSSVRMSRRPCTQPETERTAEPGWVDVTAQGAAGDRQGPQDTAVPRLALGPPGPTLP